MALDEALMERAAASGEWVLRVYSWSAPTVSFGRHQIAKGHYDAARLRSLGAGVVRRPTGGRAILHHREITYSVTAPTANAGDLRASLSRINRILTGGLTRLGVPVTPAAPKRRALAPGLSPCFAEPAAGELVVDGQKLVGSAQYRADGALLQHGSILVDDDQSLLSGLDPESDAVPPPATLRGCLGRAPEPAELLECLVDGVRRDEDPDVAPLVPDVTLRARSNALVVRYLDDTWTWRR